MQDSRSNRKLIFNYPRKFVDNETGYLLGKSVNYISKIDNSEIIDKIDHQMSHWDKEHNIQLRKQSEIFGESYELHYTNQEGEFSVTILTPLSCFVLEDGTADRNVLLALHRFTKPFEDKQYLDVYTQNEIIHYEIGKEEHGKGSDKPNLIYLGKHNHIFDRVPIVSCPANTERKSGFHDLISLFDAYNALNSDLVNEIADHRNAYLVIENAKIEEEDLVNMKKMGIIQVPAGGKVSWLTKDINDSFVKNELDNLEQKIYDLMDEVNFNMSKHVNRQNLTKNNLIKKMKL